MGCLAVLIVSAYLLLLTRRNYLASLRNIEETERLLAELRRLKSVP